MAFTADVNTDRDAPPLRGDQYRQMINALVNDVRYLRTQINGVLAKLDLDAGVTDNNYTALWSVVDATLQSSHLLIAPSDN